MKTTTTILPGVKSIAWIDCDKLPRRVDLHGICRAPVPVLTALNPVPFFDSPECSCTTERVNGSFKDTVSLKFHSGSLLPIHLNLGFVVCDNNGSSWLIGSKEHPFPKVEVKHSAGSCDVDAAGFFYEISHVAIKSMIPCIT